MDGLVYALTLIAALGSGLVAGIMLGFSTSVVPGLRDLPPAQAIVAMQRFDRAIYNPVFLTVFTGTTLASVVSVVVALARWSEPGAALGLAGGLLYLATVVITGAVHLPRNAVLQGIDPAGADSADWWAGYVATWMTWNHVRTLTALAGAAAFTVALAS